MPQPIWIKFYAHGRLSDTLTFNDTTHRVHTHVTELKEAGVERNDRVVVQMPNSIQTVMTYFALKNIGAIAVPVNPFEPQTKIAFILKDCGPKIIIGPSGKIKKIKKKKNTPSKKKLHENITTIIYTSGTTGTPKGACLSSKNWEVNAQSLIKHHQLNSSTTIATPLPLFHCNAHGFAMYASFLAKSKLILFDKTPNDFLDIINKERVHIGSIVPSILHELLDSNPAWQPHSQFKYFLTAAAPLRNDLLQRVMNQWSINVVQGYGLTESTNFSCTLPTHLSKKAYKKIMFPQPSIGIALPGVQIKINDIKKNKVGEISIKSKANFLGYWRKLSKRKPWLKTGDIGYYKIFSGKRFYYIQGRTQEVINRGGEKIYPLELEEEIRSLGLQGEFYIFSILDKQYGEEIGLAVSRPFDFSILEKIPLYRRPKKVYRVKKFFFTPTGKIKRSILVKQDSQHSAQLLWQYRK